MQSMTKIYALDYLTGLGLGLGSPSPIKIRALYDIIYIIHFFLYLIPELLTEKSQFSTLAS